MPISAVITGDIVGSTQLSAANLRKMMKEFTTILSGCQYEFFRGDSFQVYVKPAEEALAVVLRMRIAAMKIKAEANMPLSDVTASIGIGQVRPGIKLLRTATDEAFILSGRTFDTLKAPQRLVIAASDKNEITNIGLQVAADYTDHIFQRLTVKQAAVVNELLLKRTQTETARRLKKSQATVNKHAQSAAWPEIEKLLGYYKLLAGTVIL